MMTPVRSAITARQNKPTPRKRGAQVRLIKKVQETTGKERPEGDWIHTAGPGKVAINYWIYERAFHSSSTYIITEYFPDLYKQIGQETYRLRKTLSNHPWSNPITTRRNEIFNQTVREIKKGRKILVVDADLCTGLASLIEHGIIEGIMEVCHAQREIKQDFFLAITCSTRKSTHTYPYALSTINSIVKAYNGKLIDENPYKDGANMTTLLWYFKQ